MWPLLVRELRCAGRVGSNYWLRTFGAGLLLSAAVLDLGPQESGSTEGLRLFALLHRTLTFGIWILVPILTADCIARERREGTLDLLFLTPLRASEIVVAKSLLQAFRAISVWLAAVPVLMLPLMMGGVSFGAALLSVLINTASLLLAVSAGIWASARNQQWWRASFTALATALILMGCFALLFAAIALAARQSTGVLRVFDITSRDFVALFFFGFWFLLGLVFKEQFWLFLTSRAGTVESLNTILALVVVASFLMLILVVFQSGHYVQRALVRRKVRTSIIDRFGGNRVVVPAQLYRAWTRWKLSRNPIGWLEQRTWSSRMTMWIWLSIVMGVSLGALATQTKLVASESLMFNRLLGWGLVLTMAIVSAGSFLRERENGVLSLLLVTPLRVREIILGRLKGIWSQFSLAAIFLLASWLYLLLGFSNKPQLVWILFFAAIFLSLPAIGLYFSLSRKGFFAALCWTLAIAVGLPCLWLQVVFWGSENDPFFLTQIDGNWGLRTILFSTLALYSGYGLLLQPVIAGFLVSRLARKLATRQFHYV